MNSLIQWFMTHLSGAVSKEMLVFIVSMVPILELRGGIIVASLLDIEMWRAVFFCGLGNVIPVPFILLFITPIFRWLKQTRLFRPMVERLEAKAISKSEKIEKYEFWGLVLFVGIPLPGTGAWTGSLVAALLGIKFRKAFPAVLLGIVLAMIIMTVLFYVAPGLIL